MTIEIETEEEFDALYKLFGSLSLSNIENLIGAHCSLTASNIKETTNTIYNEMRKIKGTPS